MTLAGKRVLITGGSTGVGADLARGFAAAGAEVTIASRQATTRSAKPEVSNVRALVVDVTDEASVMAMFRTAGPCDIVIANAGAADSAPFEKASLDHWHTMINVNLTGTFLTLREGLRQMPGWGRLISIASTAGLKGYAYVAPYTAAKHGVVGLTRAVAFEVARRDITVNAICPGYVATEMTDRTLANIIQKTGMTHDAAYATLAKANPQNRLIAPAEITAMALWLCSDAARSINGQALAVAGGEL